MNLNPYDVEQMADTIVKAFRMSPAERTTRMKRMRRVVRKENVFWWVDSFLKAGAKLGGQSVGVMTWQRDRNRRYKDLSSRTQ